MIGSNIPYYILRCFKLLKLNQLKSSLILYFSRIRLIWTLILAILQNRSLLLPERLKSILCSY